MSKDTAQMQSWLSFPKPSNKRMGREKPVGEDIAKGVGENQENREFRKARWMIQEYSKNTGMSNSAKVSEEPTL